MVTAVWLLKPMHHHQTFRGAWLGWALTLVWHGSAWRGSPACRACNLIRFDAIQCNTLELTASQVNSLRVNAIQCIALQCNSSHSLQFAATHYDSMQVTISQCIVMQCIVIKTTYIVSKSLQFNAIRCNALQDIIMQSNAKQFTPIHCCTPIHASAIHCDSVQSKCQVMTFIGMQ